MDISNINKAIATALITDRDGLINLLKKNGVIITSKYSDREIIIAVLESVRSSDRFKNDLSNFLAGVVHQNMHAFTGEGMFGFTGENMFRLNGVHPPNGWYGADGHREPAPAAWKTPFDGSPNEWQSITNSSGGGSVAPSPSPMPSSAPKSGSTFSQVFNASTISNILNQGLGVLSTSLTNKSNKQLADKALEIEREKTKQAELLAMSGGTGTAAKSGLSTGAKIGIAIGVVAIVGTVVFLLVRRHKVRKLKGGGKTGTSSSPAVPAPDKPTYKKHVSGSK